jgi:hypothetical protein
MTIRTKLWVESNVISSRKELSKRYVSILFCFVHSFYCCKCTCKNGCANKLQQGCCQADIRMCSHCLFPVVVTSLEQVFPTWSIQAIPDKLLRACCHHLVNNFLRADDIGLVGTTCRESVGLINFVWIQLYTYKNAQVVTNLQQTHCLFPACWQVLNGLLTTCRVRSGLWNPWKSLNLNAGL